jgi:hypothetical protein
VQASVHTVELLSERLGRPTGYAAVLMHDLLGPLQLPMEVRPGSWYPVADWDAVTEKARPLREQRVRELAASGIDVAGAKLVEPKPMEPSARASPARFRSPWTASASNLGPHVLPANHDGLFESTAS